ARRRDADALLAAAHAQAVELRPVEELGEDGRDLLADDAGTVVAHRDAEARGLAGRRRRPVARRDREGGHHVGHGARPLGGVEGVVHRFLHAGEERLARIVEAEEMAVLGEELGDGDLALARAHLGGGDGSFGRSGGSGRLREGGGHLPTGYQIPAPSATFSVPRPAPLMAGRDGPWHNQSVSSSTRLAITSPLVALGAIAAYILLFRVAIVRNHPEAYVVVFAVAAGLAVLAVLRARGRRWPAWVALGFSGLLLIGGAWVNLAAPRAPGPPTPPPTGGTPAHLTL